MNDNRQIGGHNKLHKTDEGSKAFYLFLQAAFLINLIELIYWIYAAYGPGSLFGFSGRRLLGTWPIVLILICLGAGLRHLQEGESSVSVNLVRSIYRKVSSLRSMNVVLFVLLILLFSYVQLAGVDLPVIYNFSTLWLFGHIGLLGAIFLSGTRRTKPSFSLLVSFSIYGLVLCVVKFLPDIHTYPLSAGWSEASRYYYASLFFSRRIYDQWVPLSSLHPSRYLMQSVPFSLPSLPLWFHRFWQALLWLGLTFTGGMAMVRRLVPAKRNLWLPVTAWFSLFVFQGPVYYHLMVVVILVLLGFNKQKLGYSLGVVLVASLWAGISRVNWFPVAGMLAVILYVLEVPQGEKEFWHYWRWPILTFLSGVILAFVSQAGYVVISGKPPEVFASSFSSPLFAYRLFPNEVFGLGIIPLILIASAPLLVIIGWRVFPQHCAWHPLRLLALLSIAATLFGGGLVVSTKIGGGNNLHNMDAYMVVMAVIAAYCLFDCFVPDHPNKMPVRSPSKLLIILAFLIPLAFVVDLLQPYPDYDHAQAWEDIRQLQALIDQKVPEGGRVLFIQSRHLLTFNLIDGVELIPDYEKVFLMEMAMSGNRTYLNNFRKDLEAHRFDLIVTQPVGVYIRPRDEWFAEENNVWVTWVNWPLVEHYSPLLELKDSEMVIMAPKLVP